MELSQEEQRLKASDAKRVADFGALIKTDGWKAYTELLQYHINERAGILMQPLPSSDVNAAYRQEYQKGAMFGLNFAMDLPVVTIAAHKAASAVEGDE